MCKAVGFALGILICLAGSRSRAGADDGEQAAPAVPSAPIPPAEAPRHMTLPEGFTATLFAGEPDVVQPIAMTFDDRGRLWVAECLSYPNWHDRPPTRARTASSSSRTPTATAVSTSAPSSRTSWLNLSRHRGRLRRRLRLRDAEPAVHPRLNARRRPSPPGRRRSLLDGWDIKQARHNVFNGLTWGPDGWLYGCNGILSPNPLVGKPGTPDDERVGIRLRRLALPPDAADLRGRRPRHDQPLGPRLRRVRPGVHHQLRHQAPLARRPRRPLPAHVRPGRQPQRLRPDGKLRRPHPLGRRRWTDVAPRRPARTCDAGGGHAHVGAMVYLGDNWPDELPQRSSCQPPRQPINHDILERHGSGYVARHGKDFLLANDPWFRGISSCIRPRRRRLRQRLDRHRRMPQPTRSSTATNGRIYKIAYGKPAAVPR